MVAAGDEMISDGIASISPGTAVMFASRNDAGIRANVRQATQAANPLDAACPVRWPLVKTS